MNWYKLCTNSSESTASGVYANDTLEKELRAGEELSPSPPPEVCPLVLRSSVLTAHLHTLFPSSPLPPRYNRIFSSSRSEKGEMWTIVMKRLLMRTES